MVTPFSAAFSYQLFPLSLPRVCMAVMPARDHGVRD
jgi:hypothetical protein